jgi:hypothetical protein
LQLFSKVNCLNLKSTFQQISQSIARTFFSKLPQGKKNKLPQGKKNKLPQGLAVI